MYKQFTTENGIDLVIYAPGYKKDDFEVSRDDNKLRITGIASSKYACREEIDCEFFLSDDVGDIDPEFTDGLLILHITKAKKEVQKFNIR